MKYDYPWNYDDTERNKIIGEIMRKANHNAHIAYDDAVFLYRTLTYERSEKLKAKRDKETLQNKLIEISKELSSIKRNMARGMSGT